MVKGFDIGDLVKYNALVPTYLPGFESGIGIVLQVGITDLRIYSMTKTKQVIAKATDCHLLSAASKRTHEY